MLRMDGGALAAAGTTAQTGKAASARTRLVAWISMAHGMHVRHVRVMVASLMTLSLMTLTLRASDRICIYIYIGCALDCCYLMTLKASDRIYIYRERLCIR